MRILRALTIRDYIYIPVVLFLAFKVLFGGGGDGSIPDAITHTVTDTVVVERLVTQVVREANRGPSLIERISERELQPEEIAISPPVYGDAETPGCADGEGSGACSPEWGIHHIEKEGRSLTVSAISDSTGEAQRLSYTLPDSDSDFVLRSGNQPPRLSSEWIDASLSSDWTLRLESLEGLIPQVENLRLDLRWRGQSQWEPTDLEQVLRS
jgi:hypothetical protein